MSLKTELESLTTVIGVRIRDLVAEVGAVSTLNTTDKASVVAAVNELHAILQVNAALINDTAASTDTEKTYSANKITALLAQTRADILGGLAPAALDTITELAAFLTDNTVASGLISQLANRVRIDEVQNLSETQKTQAINNIGAASVLQVSDLSAAIGNTNTNFVSIFNAALVS